MWERTWVKNDFGEKKIWVRSRHCNPASHSLLVTQRLRELSKMQKVWEGYKTSGTYVFCLETTQGISMRSSWIDSITLVWAWLLHVTLKRAAREAGLWASICTRDTTGAFPKARLYVGVIILACFSIAKHSKYENDADQEWNENRVKTKKKKKERASLEIQDY